MPDNVLFYCIGILASFVAGGIWGLLYYLAILHFFWAMTMLYAPLLFIALAATFITYAMFRAAVFGESNAAPDE